MTKLILALIAGRFFTANMRRTLVLGSFYSLLRKCGNCHDKMQELNSALGISADCRSLLLAGELPSILWKEQKQEEMRSLPPERLKKYYHEIIPTWLKYDREDNGFNFDEDLNNVMNIVLKNNA